MNIQKQITFDLALKALQLTVWWMALSVIVKQKSTQDLNINSECMKKTGFLAYFEMKIWPAKFNWETLEINQNNCNKCPPQLLKLDGCTYFNALFC